MSTEPARKSGLTQTFQKIANVAISVSPGIVLMGMGIALGLGQQTQTENAQRDTLIMAAQSQCAQKTLDTVLQEYPERSINYTGVTNFENTGRLSLSASESRPFVSKYRERIFYTVESTNRKFHFGPRTRFTVAVELNQNPNDYVSEDIAFELDSKGKLSLTPKTDDYVGGSGADTEYKTLFDARAKAIEQNFTKCVTTVFDDKWNHKFLTPQPLFGM